MSLLLLINKVNDENIIGKRIKYYICFLFTLVIAKETTTTIVPF